MANKQKNENLDDNFAQPIFENNGYLNPLSFLTWVNPPSFTTWTSWGNLYNFICREKNLSAIPKDQKILNETLPVRTPEFPIQSALGATWLGHATVFVRIGNMSLITDPVWSGYASPFSWIGCRRYRPPPSPIDQLPEINIAVISHNHYDHLDHKAVKELTAKFPKIQWFVPKGLARWMQTTLGEKAKENIHELNWGENHEIECSGEKFQIWSVPAQHWSQRSLWDRNTSLWSGWLIKGSKHSFYFTGDTGFCEDEFRKIGNKFGPVDLCAIPIGCYSPRWFMHPQHIDPEEAVKIHKLVKSKKSIAIHWGTYEMGSCEPYMEPVSKLAEAAEKWKLNEDEFVAVGHGESWQVESMADPGKSK